MDKLDQSVSLRRAALFGSTTDTVNPNCRPTCDSTDALQTYKDGGTATPPAIKSCPCRYAGRLCCIAQHDDAATAPIPTAGFELPAYQPEDGAIAELPPLLAPERVPEVEPWSHQGQSVVPTLFLAGLGKGLRLVWDCGFGSQSLKVVPQKVGAVTFSLLLFYFRDLLDSPVFSTNG